MTETVRDDTPSDWATRTTISVVDAGKVLGLGRSAAYDAVRRGDLPVLRIGRRYLVPVVRLQSLLAGDVRRADDVTPS